MEAAALLLRAYRAVLRSGSCAVRGSLPSVNPLRVGPMTACHGGRGTFRASSWDVDCAVGWGPVKSPGLVAVGVTAVAL